MEWTPTTSHMSLAEQLCLAGPTELKQVLLGPDL